MKICVSCRTLRHVRCTVQGSMFYDLLNDFINAGLKEYKITSGYLPVPKDDKLIVDYKIEATKPIFLYGIMDNTKALKVIISRLNFQKDDIPFRSLMVHENLEKLNSFNRKQITNIADKQFGTLEDFKDTGPAYIVRELSAS